MIKLKSKITNKNGKNTSSNSKFRKGVLLLLFISILSGGFLTVMTTNKQEAQAYCIDCWVCAGIDVLITFIIMEAFKNWIFVPIIVDNLEDHIKGEENWIVEEFFKRYFVTALAELTEFLGALGMYQVAMVGTFFDAKNSLETRRLFFKLQAEAHKDYHPSDDFCWFGTNSRSMLATESRANLNKLALSKRSLQRQIGHKNSAASGIDSVDKDKNARWDQFVKTYCDPKDNSWDKAGKGLDLACDRDGNGSSTATGAIDISRVNRDVDYTRLIDEPRTLNVNFSDTHANITDIPADEEDVLAMASNLYGSDVLSRRLSLLLMDKPAANRLYLNLRSIAAKRNVAESSYNAIVSMKSAGTNGDASATAQPDVGSYMAALMKDLMPTGTPNSEIVAIMGENPSYYAQLELLGKKIYQNPDFFANLYDKPANIKRKSVAMKAIELMLDRALFESELRQEMLLSVMLSSKLNKNYRIINRDLAVEAAK